MLDIKTSKTGRKGPHPRRPAMTMPVSSPPINPKPLVGSDTTPRRRHSFGSTHDLHPEVLDKHVGQALVEAAARRNSSKLYELKDDQQDRATQEYRSKLSCCVTEVFENVNNEIDTIAETSEQSDSSDTKSIDTETETESQDNSTDEATPAESVKEKTTYRSKLPIWMKTRGPYSTGLSVNSQLHEEILDYVAYTEVVVKQMAVQIEATIAKVRRCVRILWPHASIKTFGSYSTGLWLPSSDVDLVLMGVKAGGKKNEVSPLLRLSTLLEKEQWVESILVVETAKVPLIKIKSSDSNVPIDITFESTSTHSGLLARDLVLEFCDKIPEVYPLAIVLKQLLRERDLNEAYAGGLSSYSTVLMVVHFLQLWGAGKHCFRNASIYANGSLPQNLETPQPRRVKKKAKAKDAKQGISYANAALAGKCNPGQKMSYAAVASSSPVKDTPPAEDLRKNEPTVPSFKNVLVRGLAKGTAKEEHCPEDPSPEPDMDEEEEEEEEEEDDDDGEHGCLGTHLLNLTEFFGITFNYKLNGISVRNGGFIFRTADEACVGKPALVIEDPIYPTHNVGASSFAINKVATCFENTHYGIKYYRPSRFCPTALSSLLNPAGHEDVMLEM